jgi:HJR/Mrr/RecB family endonuclease
MAGPDARVVITNVPYFYGGWERAARNGYDLWARVDDFLARKRRGEIRGMYPVPLCRR